MSGLTVGRSSFDPEAAPPLQSDEDERTEPPVRLPNTLLPPVQQASMAQQRPELPPLQQHPPGTNTPPEEHLDDDALREATRVKLSELVSTRVKSQVSVTKGVSNQQNVREQWRHGEILFEETGAVIRNNETS